MNVNENLHVIPTASKRKFALSIFEGFAASGAQSNQDTPAIATGHRPPSSRGIYFGTIVAQEVTNPLACIIKPVKGQSVLGVDLNASHISDQDRTSQHKTCQDPRRAF